MSTPIRPSVKNMVKPSRVEHFWLVPKCVPRLPRYDFHSSPMNVSGSVISSLYRLSCALTLVIVRIAALGSVVSILNAGIRYHETMIPITPITTSARYAYPVTEAAVVKSHPLPESPLYLTIRDFMAHLATIRTVEMNTASAKTSASTEFMSVEFAP